MQDDSSSQTQVDSEGSQQEDMTVSVVPDPVPEEPTEEDTSETSEEETQQDEEEDDKDDAAVDNEIAKKARKSQKEWQAMKEEVKTVKGALETVAKTLGVTKEEDDGEEDLQQKVIARLESLEQGNKRKDWEMQNLHVISSKYNDKWTEICKKKEHLVKSGDLTYDELWQLIDDGKAKETEKLLREQERNEGSQAPASKTSVSKGDIDPEVYSWMKSRGWSDAQIKATGT